MFEGEGLCGVSHKYVSYMYQICIKYVSYLTDTPHNPSPSNIIILHSHTTYNIYY
jgi:hypothetical protein